MSCPGLRTQGDQSAAPPGPPGGPTNAPDPAGRLAALEEERARLQENRRRAVDAARARAARVRAAVRRELAAPAPPPYREIARRCRCSLATVYRTARDSVVNPPD
jgi:hypothetical protein